MNEWIPLILALVLGTILILVLTFLLRVLIKLTAEVKQTAARIEKLEKRLNSQVMEVAALKKALEAPKQDPIMGIVETAMNWRSRGPWMTVGLVGARLFQSYWKNRNSRALPGPKE